MPQVQFKEMMEAAEAGRYAVGYFESWNMESLFAVADAATAMRSPVILGFSGIHLPAAEQDKKERLRVCANLGTALCRSLPVPACLVFNESPHMDWVLEGIRVGFDMVMYTDETLSLPEQQLRVRRVVEQANPTSVAVEGEMTSLPGVNGVLTAPPGDLRLTDPEMARDFVECTGVDALAVNIGQVHVHGRRQVQLNFGTLERLRQTVPVPLVLHGATSVSDADLAEAVRLGVRKINVGSALKTVYFEGLRRACRAVDGQYNPYEVLGSGSETDVLAAGRHAMTAKVEHYMRVFGSAGKAELTITPAPAESIQA
ncbi:MAG: class II fructose-bisphosphate aldolase [Bryobacteraceae bacterium]